MWAKSNINLPNNKSTYRDSGTIYLERITNVEEEGAKLNYCSVGSKRSFSAN